MNRRTEIIQIFIVIFGVFAGFFSIWAVWTSVQAIGTASSQVVSPAQLEVQLREANIILSSSPSGVETVRNYLKFDSAYQVLSQNILKLLKNKRIAGDAVPLDLINGTYKELLGKAADEYITSDKYYNFEQLENSIFLAWNVVNRGTDAQSFQDIAESKIR